jgi:hypothetical protein
MAPTPWLKEMMNIRNWMGSTVGAVRITILAGRERGGGVRVMELMGLEGMVVGV